jgi:hypothetical protein
MCKSFIAMWAGIGMLVASWLFPPTPQVVTNEGELVRRGRFCFIFTALKGGDHELNLTRLLFTDLSIISATGGIIYMLRKK